MPPNFKYVLKLIQDPFPFGKFRFTDRGQRDKLTDYASLTGKHRYEVKLLISACSIVF